jgi:hypothetical protein
MLHRRPRSISIDRSATRGWLTKGKPSHRAAISHCALDRRETRIMEAPATRALRPQAGSASVQRPAEEKG